MQGCVVMDGYVRMVVIVRLSNVIGQSCVDNEREMYTVCPTTAADAAWNFRMGLVLGSVRRIGGREGEAEGGRRGGREADWGGVRSAFLLLLVRG